METELIMELLGAPPPAHLSVRIPATLHQIPADTEASKETVRQMDRTNYQAQHPSARGSKRDTKPSENEAELRHQCFHDATAPAVPAALHHAKTDALDRHYNHAVLLPPMHRVNARDRVAEHDRVS
jgi:hypothetical protein